MSRSLQPPVPLKTAENRTLYSASGPFSDMLARRPLRPSRPSVEAQVAQSVGNCDLELLWTLAPENWSFESIEDFAADVRRRVGPSELFGGGGHFGEARGAEQLVEAERQILQAIGIHRRAVLQQG